MDTQTTPEREREPALETTAAESGSTAAAGYGRLSEVPLMETVLCKHSGTTWSEIFEITKLAYSRSGKCVFVHSMTGMPGNQVTNYFWRETAEMDEKWRVVDVKGHNVSDQATASK